MKIIHFCLSEYFSNLFHKNKGFTLLEAIVAIFILMVAGGAAFVLIQQTLISTSLIEDRFIASYLIQEGMEIVRNLRDKAWLENKDWDTYLQDGDWQADYSSQTLNTFNPNDVLKIDSNSFYSYSSGTKTKFKRKITISEKTDLDSDGKPDKMKVIVRVDWSERGRNHNLEAVEYLTNWKR